MKTVITMCHWNRPQYTRESLAAIGRCRGIADAILLPHVEPGCEEVVELCRAVDFCETHVTLNPRKYGAPLNTVVALSEGFRHENYVIHIEDDIVLAPDALDFFRWAAEYHFLDAKVFSVTAFARATDEDIRDGMSTFFTGLRKWFHPWGFALWEDRFAKVAGHMAAAPAYDPWLTHDWVLPNDLREAYPVLGRCQNIGEERSDTIAAGRRDPGFEAWQRNNQRVAHWAGPHEISPGQFVLKS